VALLLAVLAFAGLLLPASTTAQTFTKKTGFGGIVGRNNGMTVKLYLEDNDFLDRIEGTKTLDLTLSWNFDDFMLWSGHLQTERPIPESPLHFFIGPGFTFGIDRRTVLWGPSMNLGVLFNRKRFEVFLQVTPRILLVPDTSGELGSAVGLRYFL